MLRLIAISLLCFLQFSLSAQDQVRIMYYNLLNYPGDTPERVGELRQIMGYAKPDVLVVNELLTEEGANLILEEGLNVWGEEHYAAATFIDGPDTDNMLYYNSEILGLVSQQQIPTGLRDISEYILYYKNPGLGALSDTVYLQLYAAHLKAGTGFFNQRKEEALVLKYHLNTLNNEENIFVGGDFNFYSGNESGCLALRETGDVGLTDPIDRIGDWNNNGVYAAIHTQSTRTAPLADGAGGGLDDRFDLIFVSEDVMNNTNGVAYISSSYEALGQDGGRFNQAVNSPYNASLPDSVTAALYFMSDHLPVMMDVALDHTAELERIEQNKLAPHFNPVTRTMNFGEVIRSGTFTLYNTNGQGLLKVDLNEEKTIVIPADRNISGLVFWSLNTQNHQLRGKLITD